jgi:hypothetical protein
MSGTMQLIRLHSLALLTAILTLVFVLSSCTGGSSVALLIGGPDGNTSSTQVGCYLSAITGSLITDPSAGTAIVDEESGDTYPVSWPPGFTGRQNNSQVEVLNTSGSVVAQTGTRVHLLGGWYNHNWVACGDYITTLPALLPTPSPSR